MKVQVNLTYNFLFYLEQTLPNSTVRLRRCTSLMYVIKHIGAVVSNRQAREKDRIGVITEDSGKMRLQ